MILFSVPLVKFVPRGSFIAPTHLFTSFVEVDLHLAISLEHSFDVLLSKSIRPAFFHLRSHLMRIGQTKLVLIFPPFHHLFLPRKVYFVNDRKMAMDDEDRHLFYPIVSPEALPCDSLGKLLPGSSV